MSSLDIKSLLSRVPFDATSFIWSLHLKLTVIINLYPLGFIEKAFAQWALLISRSRAVLQFPGGISICDTTDSVFILRHPIILFIFWPVNLFWL